MDGSTGKTQSGRILLRIAPELHGALSDMAAAQEVSLNQYIQNILAGHRAGVATAEYCFRQAANRLQGDLLRKSESMLEQIERHYVVGYKSAASKERPK